MQENNLASMRHRQKKIVCLASYMMAKYYWCIIMKLKKWERGTNTKKWTMT